MSDLACRRTLTPESVGVGLKPAHYREAVACDREPGWAGEPVSSISFFEVHAENYMCAGGPAHDWLSAVRARFPISLHGVCLSLAGLDPLDSAHLKRLRTLVDRYEPSLISEHIAWSAHDGQYFNDLIAPPLTEECLTRVANRIDATQQALGAKILVENPSRYMQAPGEIAEPTFLNELARRTSCGLLLDINNIYVSAHNLIFDPYDYLTAIDADNVGEIHLAGHAVDPNVDAGLLIDDHGSAVPDAVGALYKTFVRTAGPRPTLVEWDKDTPTLSVLAGEARKARDWMIAAQDGGAEKPIAVHETSGIADNESHQFG